MSAGKKVERQPPKMGLGWISGAGIRLAAAILAGIFVAVAVPSTVEPSIRAVAGWNSGGLVFLALAWWVIARQNQSETRKHAAADDPGRSMVGVIALAASAFSLFAAMYVLRKAEHLARGSESALAALALAAVPCAWFVLHTSYTLRYAHLYYREDVDGGEGGLDFPGSHKPNYMDFAYFAFTVGMCFQVSDVAVASTKIRRAVLSHSILSFVYNTALLALVVNQTVALLND